MKKPFSVAALIADVQKQALEKSQRERTALTTVRRSSVVSHKFKKKKRKSGSRNGFEFSPAARETLLRQSAEFPPAASSTRATSGNLESLESRMRVLLAEWHHVYPTMKESEVRRLLKPLISAEFNPQRRKRGEAVPSEVVQRLWNLYQTVRAKRLDCSLEEAKRSEEAVRVTNEELLEILRTEFPNLTVDLAKTLRGKIYARNRVSKAKRKSKVRLKPTKTSKSK